MFIVSLAIADLIVGLLVMPISAIYIFTSDWSFGVVVCQAWIGVDYIASTASILNLFILSLDRYWSVRSPLIYLRKRTKRRALIMISIVWCVSSLWIVPIVAWHHIVRQGVRIVPENVCDTEYATNSAFKVITAFFNFYLPLAVMYSLYIKIFQEIRKRSEFELGQRNIGSKPISYQTGNTSHSGEDSEIPDNTFSEDNYQHHCSQDEQPNSTNAIKRGNSNNKNVKGYKNLRLIAVQKQMGSGRENHNSNHSYKVEYVYDETVMDPQTERIERYYYEEHLPLTQKPSSASSSNHKTLTRSETSLSQSTSSASTFEDVRPDNDKTKGENFSLMSGIRRIRQAEKLLDKTVTVTSERGSDKDKTLFVLRDDKNRRLTGVLNIKDRIRNLRQTSALTKEIKAARQLGVIMGAFTLCFLPYFILFLVVAFCEGCIDPGLLTAMTWVGYLNSTLNPFLYPLCNLQFRRKFRKMFGVLNKQRNPGQYDINDRNSLTNARFD
ncbi:hypothetical protein SNE40_014646 [Patella caerulea]|uniref:G-protein coupled receptors family 1 profile domain-containing protein n=1 Tax=Patella caerulea TaxID=87958 RepID=A0AAN8JIQ0_PATCE